MQDCVICLSAGSVNQWGVCELCGEEVEDLTSVVTSFAEDPLAPLAAE